MTGYNYRRLKHHNMNNRHNIGSMLVHYLVQSQNYKSAFEIGVDSGGTFELLMNICDIVHGIDLNDRIHKDTRRVLDKSSQHNFTICDSTMFKPYGSWDFINADGNHDYKFAINDINIAKEMLAPAGTIMADDGIWHSGGIQGLEEFFSNNKDYVPFLADEQAIYIHHVASNKEDFIDNILPSIFGKFCYIHDFEYAGFTIPKVACLPAVTRDNEVFDLIVENNNF